jgi:hypothetical protein
MFKHLFSKTRRQAPRDTTVLIDRRPAPMPRIRYYG